MFRRITAAFLVLTTIFIIYAYLQFFSGYVFSWNKKEAIQTTLEWGGLAPLPTPLKDIDIEKRGSTFTRQFIIEFTASENQIKDWVKNSKRLRDNFPKQKGKKKIYEIHPGEAESLGGNVEIEGQNVKIDISWN